MTQDMNNDDLTVSESEEASLSEADSSRPESVSEDDPAVALAAERDQLRDLLLRKQAEFENFRKRTERERSEFVQFALADFMKEILNVLDSFELALKDIAGGGDESLAIHRGYELIYKQLLESMQRFGLEEIQAEGQPFDPHIHEGVGTQPSAEVPEGSVLAELRKGYMLKGKLLRATMVTVASPPGDSEGGA